MVAAILTLVAGLIAALPQFLMLLERRAAAQAKGVFGAAKHDADLLESVLRPPAP